MSLSEEKINGVMRNEADYALEESIHDTECDIYRALALLKADVDSECKRSFLDYREGNENAPIPGDLLRGFANTEGVKALRAMQLFNAKFYQHDFVELVEMLEKGDSDKGKTDMIILEMNQVMDSELEN